MRAEGSGGEPQSEEETDELAAVALWGGTRQPPPSQAACAHNLKLPQHGHPPRAAASGARIALRLHKTIEPSPPGLELGLKGAAAVTLDEAWLDLMCVKWSNGRAWPFFDLSLSLSLQPACAS